MPLPSFTHPGLTLGSISSYSPGPGTHIYGTSICASLRGKPSISESNSLKPTISVILPSPVNTIPSRNITSRNILPFVNAIVLARVTRLQQRQVNVFILVVDDIVCADAFVGVVRKEDVRGWEVDKVKIEEMFRVGDTVRAVVISLGDQSSYYLSTARNELGVLLATSGEGNQMYPVSWKEFRDPVTGKHERRKVAKPV